MNRDEINKLLLHFLKTIYHYERNEIAEFGLNFQEVYTLRHLEENGSCNIGEIAAELRIKHFAASRVISRLEKKEYVEKVRTEADRRIFTAKITQTGISVVRAIEEKHTEKILRRLEENQDLDINAFIETAENIHRVLDINIEGEQE